MAPDPKPLFPVDLARHRQLYQLVEHIAINQRLEVAAYQHIRRWLLRDSVDHHAQRVGRPGFDLVLDIAGEVQHLLLTLTFHIQRHSHERRIVDADAHLLYRGNQEVVIAIAADDGGKQPHHRLATDRRTQVIPGAITGDAHVDVTAEVRVPQMYRRQALGLGNLRQKIIGLAGIAHHACLIYSHPEGYERTRASARQANPPGFYRGTSTNRHGS